VRGVGEDKGGRMEGRGWGERGKGRKGAPCPARR